MTVMRFAIRARWIDSGVYVNKGDLLKWFDTEAAAHRAEGLEEEAVTIESIAASLRKVRAS